MHDFCFRKKKTQYTFSSCYSLTLILLETLLCHMLVYKEVYILYGFKFDNVIFIKKTHLIFI